MQLEYLITSLLHPLRNALLYRQAVNSALRDPLTGLNNRSCFEISVKREVDLAHRHNSELAMIVLDVDNFKNINDVYGHLVGDCILREIAESARDSVRSTDIAFRYGGEEFVVLLNSTGKNGAYLLAERIRRNIQKKTCTYGEHSIKVSASLGIACLREGESATDLFKRADEAMYQSKTQGKNRTLIAEDLELEEVAT
jgi:diguanylate cyclase (GGDEF)-like protein